MDRRLGASALAGAGLAATLDEIVLHQLLHWHMLVSRHGQDVGLVSDGVLHVLGATALVVGAVLVSRRWDGDVRGTAGGVLVGLGGFNVFDSVVNHWLLDLHRVREGVPDPLPYDLAFFGLAVLALGAGLLLRRRTAVPGRAPDPGP